MPSITVTANKQCRQLKQKQTKELLVVKLYLISNHKTALSLTKAMH